MLLAKYVLGSEAANTLISTNPKYLLEMDRGAKPTTYYGGKIDKNTGELIGKNMMGIFLMRVR